jgi:hypothetical protein
MEAAGQSYRAPDMNESLGRPGEDAPEVRPNEISRQSKFLRQT